MRTQDSAARARLRQVLTVLKRVETLLPLVEEGLAHLDSTSFGWCDEDLGEVTLRLDVAREAAEKIKATLTKSQAFIAEGFCELIATTHNGKFKCPELKATFSGGVKFFPSAPSQLKEPEKFEELITWLKANGFEQRIDVTAKGRYVIDGLGEIVETLLLDGKPYPPHVQCHMVADVRITRHRGASLEE